MKTTRLAIVALLVWVVTIGVFGWFFVRGNTMTRADGRTGVPNMPAVIDTTCHCGYSIGMMIFRQSESYSLRCRKFN